MKKLLLILVLPIMLTPTQFRKQGIKQKCRFRMILVHLDLIPYQQNKKQV